MAKSTCGGCGEIFKSTTGFDKHRTGDFEGTRRCMTVEEMQAAGMLRNAQGWWIASAYEPTAHADDEETPEISEEQAGQ